MNIDTIYQSKHVILTRHYATIVSYVNIESIVKSIFLVIGAIFILLVFFKILKSIDKMTTPEFNRSTMLLKGLILTIIGAWFMDVYLLVTVSWYDVSYVLIGITVSIFVYELLKIFLNLSSLGFAPAKFFKIVSALLGASVSKDASKAVEVLEELSNDDEFKKGNNIGNSHSNGGVKKSIRNKALMFVLLLVIPLLFATDFKQDNRVKKSITTTSEEVVVVNIENYRIINLKLRDEFVYQVKWIELGIN